MAPNMTKRIYNEIKDVNDDNTTPLQVYVPNEENMCMYVVYALDKVDV